MSLLLEVLLQFGTLVTAVVMIAVTIFFAVLIRLVPLLVVAIIRMGFAIKDAIDLERARRKFRAD
jgi:hypothetical protein